MLGGTAMADTSWLKPLVSQFNCEGYLLNSGSFRSVNSLINDTDIWNQTMNYPAWYANCTDSDETSIFIDALADLSKEFSFVPQKNVFISGNLVIAFVLSGVCIGGWMLFLLLFLLPSTNHNRQKRMVHLYVLYFSIVQTVIWKKTNDEVFETQYISNYQDSLAFDKMILEVTWSKVVRFFSLVFCNVNWIIVIYYLCSRSRGISRRWRRSMPRWLRDLNAVHWIMSLVVILCLLHVIFFGIQLFQGENRAQTSISIVFRVSQLSLFTLFLLVTIWYSYHSLKSASASVDHQGMSIFRRLLLFVHEYKEIIPLLIYNVAVYMLLYVVAILQIRQGEPSSHWIHFVIAFLRILIFVNAWGLIGKLEEREQKVSKKSLLGRKINNNDRFFVDPKINYGETKQYLSSPNETKLPKRPRLSKSYRNIFHSNGSFRNNDAESSSEFFNLQDMANKNANKPQFTDRIVSDTESVDTMLTRNVIYDHDAN